MIRSPIPSRFFIPLWVALFCLLPGQAGWAQGYGPFTPSGDTHVEFTSDQRLELLDQARAMVGREEYKKGINTYKRYLSLVPGDIQARLELARVLSWQKAYDESIRIYGALIQRVPDDPELELERARVLLWAGKYDEAILSLEGLHNRLKINTVRIPNRAEQEELSPALASQGPNALNERVDRVLLDAYAWSGQLDKAIPLYERQWSIHKDDLELGLSFARALSQGRDFAHSLEVYDELRAMGMNDLDFRLERAKVMLWAERYPEGLQALVELRRALLQLNTGGSNRYEEKVEAVNVALAAGYAWSEDYARAVREYRALVAKHPKDPALRLDLARGLRSLNMLQAALEQFDIYLSMNPKDTGIAIEKAKSLLWAEKYPESIQLLEDLREELRSMAGPGGALSEEKAGFKKEIDRLLTQAYLWSGHPNEALPHLRDLLEQDPNEAAIALELGRALALSGQYDEARETYQQYRRSGEVVSSALFGMGQTYQWEGDVLRARAAYKQALEARPPSKKAEVALASLAPDLRWKASADVTLRADVDQLQQRSLGAELTAPAGLLWLSPRVVYDNFFVGSRHPADRVHGLLKAHYRHSPRLEFDGEAGILATFDQSDRPAVPTLSLQAWGSVNPRLQLALRASSSDAVHILFTAGALEDQIRQLEGVGTLNWALSDRWLFWGQLQSSALYRPSEEGQNSMSLIQAAFSHDTMYRHELRPRLRLTALGSARFVGHEDPDYWSPALYANGGIRAELSLTARDGLVLRGRVKGGFGYSSDISETFPELSAEALVEHQITERLGWKLEGSYGRTLRLQLDAEEGSFAHNYWLGQVMLMGWGKF